MAAACGSDGDDSDGPRGAGADGGTDTTSTPLNAVLGSYLVVPGRPQRVAFAALRGREPVPAGEEVRVAFAADKGGFSEPVVATRHSEGIEERPYWTAETTFARAGVHGLRIAVGDATATAAFEVLEPGSKPPLPGQPLPPVATPTTTDPRGVKLICTREQQCPWHEVSLDEALAEGRPVALLISTPRFCRSQICGPVLESLLAAREDFESRNVLFVHAEPFTDETIKTASPIMQSYALQFEPVLYLAGADGIVQTAVDGPFDRAEARAFLEALVS